MPIRRRFGVRATAPDAMARNLALVHAFRDLERTRVTLGAILGVVVEAGLGAGVAAARPGPLLTAVAFVGAVCSFALVTFGFAALARPRRVARALELYGWVLRRDARRWHAASAEAAPSTPARARSWLEAHPGAGGSADLPRIELLVWIGEFEAARRVVATLPVATADERFERLLRRASVGFISAGDGDLDAVRGAILELPADARPEATARLAVEETRQALAAAGAGGRTRDRLEPLVRARQDLGSRVDGHLLPDLARLVARPLLLLGTISALTSFVVAGALPPR